MAFPRNALGRGLVLALLGVAAGLVVAQQSPPLKPEAVRELQAKYQEERAAAEKDGRTKQFAPLWFARAEESAKQGEAALATGRFLEAREDFHKARWQLPALPPNFPAHVARIFGEAKPMRHLDAVMALAYSSDGSRMASGGKDGVV